MLLRTFRSFLVQSSLGGVGTWIVDGDACRVKADTLPPCNGASFRYVIPVGGSVFRMAFLGRSLRRALCRCGLTVCQGKRVQRIHMHHPLIQYSRRRRLAGLAQAPRYLLLLLTFYAFPLDIRHLGYVPATPASSVTSGRRSVFTITVCPIFPVFVLVASC
jgi:hypothetical protein